MDSNADLEMPLIAPEPERVVEPPVAVIPRVVFNYFVIAAVSLAIGLVIGVVAYDRIAARSRDEVDTEVLINQAVAAAIAALPTQAVAGVPDPNMRYDVAVADQPWRGTEDASIVIVEFGDFHCGYCKRFHDQTVTPLMETYGDRVKLVYRDYPILGPDSLSAALAASCAYDQDVFWDFHDRLYANPSNLTRSAFIQYATDLDLDVNRFTTCYDDQEHRDTVIQDYNDAQSLGVSGTPTFFINGKIFVGAQPYEQFAAAIEAELAEAVTTQTS